MERKQELTENDRKKKYLRQYRESVRRVDRIEAELEETRQMKLGVPSPRLGDTSVGNGNGGDLSGYVAKLDNMASELIRERYRRIRLHEEIKRAIDAVPNETERDVLFYRYIKGLNWKEIAERMGFSERHTERVHGRALVHFKILENNT